MYLIRRVIGTFTEFAANVEVTNHSLVLVILLTRYTGRLRELFIIRVSTDVYSHYFACCRYSTCQ